MSDPGNDKASVLAYQTGNGELERLRRENEELRSRYEPSNVAESDFGGEQPRYRLNERGFYGYGMDCRLYEPGDEIVYLDHPNLTMVPLNDAARRRLQAEIDHQTSCQREKAMRDGRQFSGLITDRGVLIADADQEARRAAINVQIAMPTDKDKNMPPMPHMAPKRGPGRPRSIVKDVTPPKPTSRPGPDVPPAGIGFALNDRGS